MSYNQSIPELSAYKSLYADTDYSRLNYLEQAWVSWYVWFDNPVIATGLMSFLIHEVRFLLLQDYHN
jgi:methylsterol monooxygenase